MGVFVNKSELIEEIAYQMPDLDPQLVAKGIDGLFHAMAQELSKNNRIEVRGFGAFKNHYRKGRLAHNPKTKEKVHIKSKMVPFFVPGKELKERLNA